MDARTSFDAILPPRKEKAKTEFNAPVPDDPRILRISVSAKPQASAGGKNLRNRTPATRRYADDPRIAAAVRREEAKRARKRRGPAPKRGAVKIAIFRGAVKSTRAFLCASPTETPLEADAFLDSVPFPKKSESVATIWPLAEDASLTGASSI